MQKILIALLGLLLFGVFFFIQTKTKKRENVNQPKISKKILNHTVETSSVDDISLNKSKIIQTKTMAQKTFTPNTDVKVDNKIVSIGDIEELKLKSEHELEKDVLADIQLRMTSQMQSIPSCLENAQNKQEALACSNQLQDLNRELELILGIEPNTDTSYNTDQFIWNEETKNSMIEELDASIQPMQEMLSCMQEAQTEMELEKCYEKE